MEGRCPDARCSLTESLFIAALDLRQERWSFTRTVSFESRSVTYESAIVNLSSKSLLPCFWYQNHHWRIFYDEKLPKHTQFKDEYIYAFTWEWRYCLKPIFTLLMLLPKKLR